METILVLAHTENDGSLAKSPYLLLDGVSTGEDEQNALI